MRCASALSTHPIPAYATGDVIAELLALDEPPADLLVAFATPAFGGAADDIAETIRILLQPRNVVLVVSDGVIGAGSEVTAGSGIALWSLWLDEQSLKESVTIFSIDGNVLAHDREFSEAMSTASEVVLLGNPDEPCVTDWIDHICQLRNGRSVSGALLASSRGSLLRDYTNDSLSGLIALSLSGIESSVTLAHGTSALTSPFVVTKAVGSMLCTIGGDSALDVVTKVLSSVDMDRRAATAEDLAVALLEPETDRVMDVYRVLGADRTTGSIALSHPVITDNRIAFHRQDRYGPLADLEQSLGGTRSHGALVFSCGALNPDSELVGAGEVGLLGEALGTSAYAGIHAASVIGPGTGTSGLCSAPFSAVIFGRSHH